MGGFFDRTMPERPPAAPQAAALAVSRPSEAAERQADAAAAYQPAGGAPYDLSRVRVHTDARAAASARQLNALAYTVGHDVVFAAGQYAPHTPIGRTLLAHELAHVVQQERGGSAVQRQPAAPAPPVDIELRSPLFAGDAELLEVRNRRKLLRSGDSGDAVRKVQEALLTEGYELPNFGADGKFGPETERAVRSFQRRWRMSIDGVVGDQTLGLLDDHLVAKSVLAVGTRLGGALGGFIEGVATAALDQAEEDRRKRACPANSQAERRISCIEFVLIANDDGSAPTVAPPAPLAQRIWEKCCINYTVRGTKVINKTDYKTLDESPNNVPTAEETSLFTDAGASDCIQVFVPEQFEQAGVIGRHISGGGGTYDAGTAHPKIVIVQGAQSAVLAHEIGHASGVLFHDANNTVMRPTGSPDVANSSAVSQRVCTDARTGPVLRGTNGAADCCMFLA